MPIRRLARGRFHVIQAEAARRGPMAAATARPPPRPGRDRPVRREAPPLDKVPPPGWSSYPWPPAPYPAASGTPSWARGTRQTSDGRGPGRRRWLLPAGIAAGAAAVGAAAVLMTGGHPAARGGPPPGPRGQRRAPHHADPPRPAWRPGWRRNRRRPAASLAAPPHRSPWRRPRRCSPATRRPTTAPTPSAVTRCSPRSRPGPATRSTRACTRSSRRREPAPYPPFSPVQATYYVPRDEPAGRPRWFVVQVANAFSRQPGEGDVRRVPAVHPVRPGRRLAGLDRALPAVRRERAADRGRRRRPGHRGQPGRGLGHGRARPASRGHRRLARRDTARGRPPSPIPATWPTAPTSGTGRPR